MATTTVRDLNALAIYVTDLERSADFYRKHLGFEVSGDMPPGVLMKAGSVTLYLEADRKAKRTESQPLAEFSPCFATDSVKASHDALRAAGVRIVTAYQEYGPAFALFRDRLAGPDVRAFLAFVKGRPVGYVLIRVIRRTETTMTQAIAFVEIDHIHVRKAYRRRGIGRALAAQALDVARDVGVDTVQLNVWARNRTAVAAFRSLGFRPQRYVMKLEQPRKLERHRRPSGVKHVRRGSPPDP